MAQRQPLVRVAPPSRKSGGVAKRQEASSSQKRFGKNAELFYLAMRQMIDESTRLLPLCLPFRSANCRQHEDSGWGPFCRRVFRWRRSKRFGSL